MTTDEQEGRRQAEAMKPPALKVGDKVRLAAGGDRVMAVVELQDYNFAAVCEWATSEDAEGKSEVKRERFSVRSLVLVEREKQTG